MQGFFPASLILESKRIFSFFLSSKLFKMFLLYMQIRSTVDLAESIQGRPFQPSVSGHHVSFQQKKTVCLMMAFRFPEAELHFLNAIKYDSKNSLYHSNLGKSAVEED